LVAAAWHFWPSLKLKTTTDKDEKHKMAKQRFPIDATATKKVERAIGHKARARLGVQLKNVRPQTQRGREKVQIVSGTRSKNKKYDAHHQQKSPDLNRTRPACRTTANDSAPSNIKSNMAWLEERENKNYPAF
jgi:hypothetical protein